MMNTIAFLHVVSSKHSIIAMYPFKHWAQEWYSPFNFFWVINCIDDGSSESFLPCTCSVWSCTPPTGIKWRTTTPGLGGPSLSCLSKLIGHSCDTERCHSSVPEALEYVTQWSCVWSNRGFLQLLWVCCAVLQLLCCCIQCSVSLTIYVYERGRERMRERERKNERGKEGGRESLCVRVWVSIQQLLLSILYP